MGPEELLKPACELSYTVAREGAESQPPVDPPAAMKSFLYVAQLPARALTVAQQAIEEDPSFRRRVAQRATEGDVGRAGFLWLHRPIGWAAEFEELTMGQSADADADADVDADTEAEAGGGPRLFRSGDADSTAPDEDNDDDLRWTAEPAADADDDDLDPADEGEADDERADLETVAAVNEDDEDDLDDVAADIAALTQKSGDDTMELVGATDSGAGTAGAFGSIDVFGNGSRGLELPAPAARGRTEANAIEDELLSLRGLVDRLSNERKAVSSSVRQAEQDLAKSRYQPSMFDSDVYTLQSELDSARAELEAARRDRDTAIRQHSESLTRQLDLEKELDRSRELRAEIEREHADADAGIVDIKESLARTEATLATVQTDRDELSQSLAAIRGENEDLKLQVARLTETAATQTRTLEAQYKAIQSEAETLRSDKDALAARLSGVETDLNNARAQLSQTGNQASEAKSLVDALTEEKIDLASRLADTEAMLETTRAQLAAVKSDSEALAADLSNIRAHRDGLATQVDELHNGLTEALSDLARVRANSDADRSALKEVRSERDLLRVRVSSLEQIEKGLEAKLSNLTSERDAFALRTDQTRAELAERERMAAALEAERSQVAEELATAEQANSSLAAERDEQQAALEALQSRSTELELARDGLAVQVEQLTEENLAIQAQMVDKERQQQEASDNQGRALSELAHRLAMVENDRNRLEGELRETEQQLAEALQAVEMAMDTAEKARQGQIALEAQAAALAAAAPAPVASGPDPVADLSVPVDGAPSIVFDAVPLPPPPPPTPWASEGTDSPPAPGGLAAALAGETVEDTAPAAEAWPPPPLLAGPAEAVPAVLEKAAAPDAVGPDDLPADETPGDDRPSKRHVWSFGSRFRNDNDSDDRADRGFELEAPTPVGDQTSPIIPALAADATLESQLPPPPPLLAGSAPAAEPTGDGPVDAPPPPTPATPAPVGAGPELDELEAISTELSQAVEEVGLLPSGDDEDLDEISKLIKQTVTDFDPSSLQVPGPEGPAPLAGEPEDERRRRGPLSRRLFRTGEHAVVGEGGSGALVGPTMSSTPPSVFGGEGRLPGAGLDPDQTMVVKGGPLDGPDAFEVRPLPHSDEDRSGRTRPGRRQIELPTDLDDDVELARHVVSSPDVVLLVDGDSVAKMGWPSLPVAQQRDALVSYLADLASSTGASPDVVFDGRIGEEDALPASRAVRIRLSTPPIEPAAALDELVDAYPEQWPIAVVTDDPDLTRSAQDRGATVLNNGQLLDLFIVQ